MKDVTRKLVRIDGKSVTLRIEQDLEFDGITLEPKGEPKVVAFVSGRVVDPFEEFGMERMRRVMSKVLA
ncbi:hypothetical protein [Paracoccus sp. J39]|uniref:hypothetical protein n=1 Tax=Paracoccus sp. J39 TaxID=935848 RepID=UPI0012EB44D9|nr:hypothetical protein [Paracoccus sp. J39]